MMAAAAARRCSNNQHLTPRPEGGQHLAQQPPNGLHNLLTNRSILGAESPTAPERNPLTAASADYNGAPDNIALRALIALGHYAPIATGVMIAETVARSISGLWFSDSSLGIYPAIHLPVMLTGLLLVVLGAYIHRKKMCWREYDAKLLDDPEGQVRQHRRALFRCHLPEARRIAYGGALFAMAVPVLGDLSWMQQTLSNFLLTLAAVLGAAVFLRYDRDVRIHTRLHFYCPWCRRDDGDDTFTPTPTPDPAGTAPRA